MSTNYVISSKPLIVGGSDQKYVLTIRDLPADEKPREKLVKHGPSVLTAVELLAIVLGQGTKKEEVFSMANRLVQEYGERNIFTQTDAKTLAENLEIPLIKALQIIAVGELGRRFFEKKKNGATVIRTAKDVFDYVADMRALPKEYLRGIYLNSHYQVVHDEVISIGTVDANIIHPREVFRPALSYSASALILVHNHPSGVLSPSQEDVLVTAQVKEAGQLLGIELIDHVIVTVDGFSSMLSK
ncbi:MAG: DNA repair protein RadC [Candidatus Nomurabacteria bacterium]|nr:DNA repair protein RadC [Candidatus Nomurabacteria bacterium]USN87755.1 MAG: DNA repair protein RadC [Candidatus Nomurabacteria bacterium]